MKRNSNLLHESLKELNNFKKILSEAYMPYEEGQEEQDPRMMQQQEMGEEEPMMEDEEGLEQEANPQMDNIIDQIRQLSIQGIAEYADDIESEEYQALKKIWLLTDKFYEDLHGEDNKKKM